MLVGESFTICVDIISRVEQAECIQKENIFKQRRPR